MNVLILAAWLVVFALGAHLVARDSAESRLPVVGGVLVAVALAFLFEPLQMVINGLALAAMDVVGVIAAALPFGGWA